MFDKTVADLMTDDGLTLAIITVNLPIIEAELAKIEHERAEHRANLERILEREWEDVMATIFDIDIGTAVVAIGKDAEQTQMAGYVVNQATSNFGDRLYQVEFDDAIRVWIPEERVRAWDYDPIAEHWAADDALNIMQYPPDEPIELTKAMMI